MDSIKKIKNLKNKNKVQIELHNITQFGTNITRVDLRLKNPPLKETSKDKTDVTTTLQQ